MQRLVDEAEIMNLAARVASTMGFSLINCCFLKQTSTSAVAFLETSDGSMVLRQEAPRPGKRARYGIDAGVRRALIRVDSRVSEPIALSSDFPDLAFEVPWALDRFIPGIDGTLETVTDHVWGDLGQILAHLHGLDVPLGGWTALDRFQDPWPLWDGALERHPIAKVAPNLIDLIGSLEAEIIQASRRPAVTLHGDPGANNLRVDDGQLVGLLDYNECFKGPPAWDFAAIRHLGGLNAFDLALEGYGSVPNTFRRDAALLSIPFGLHRISRAETMDNERHRRNSTRALERDLAPLVV